MDTVEPGNLISCPLCGEEFYKEQGKERCISCPISVSIGDCLLICCPRCGYSFPQESKLILWLKKIFKQEGRA